MAPASQSTPGALERRREKARLRQREVRRADPEKSNAVARRHRLRHPENLVVSNARGNGIELDRYEVAILIRDPCAYCGGPASGVDHIVAVSKGGGSRWDNLTASCHDCNRRKRDDSLLGYLVRRVPERERLRKPLALALGKGVTVAEIHELVDEMAPCLTM
jgi:5-methylcytosine-specific restriction endonuclease McrA